MIKSITFKSERLRKNLVQKRLIDNRLTTREVAALTGVSFATISRIESGKPFDLPTFAKLCQWLGTEPNDYFEIVREIDYEEEEEEEWDDYDLLEPAFNYANSEIIEQGKIHGINGLEYDATIRKDINGVIQYSIEHNFTLHTKPIDYFPKIEVINTDDPANP